MLGGTRVQFVHKEYDFNDNIRQAVSNITLDLSKLSDNDSSPSNNTVDKKITNQKDEHQSPNVSNILLKYFFKKLLIVMAKSVHDRILS